MSIDTFSFEGMEVRTVIREGDPWWIAKDVCEALGIGNHRQAVSYLDEDERGVISNDSPSGQQVYNIISESGLYSLILRSRKPAAKRFRRWVTSDVIPSIRKTGRYTLSQAETPALPMNYEEALEHLLAKTRELRLAEAQRDALTPAAEAWEQIVNAKGEFTFATAAQMLNNLDGVSIGQNRLFDLLREWKWIKPLQGRNPRPYQTPVDSGWLACRPREPHQRKDGTWHTSAPQLLITPKGLRVIAERLLNPRGKVLQLVAGEPFSDVELASRF